MQKITKCRRLRNAKDYTMQKITQCRRLHNAEDSRDVALYFLNFLLTVTQCRRLLNADDSRDGELHITQCEDSFNNFINNDYF
ncbi:hypothetical protein M9Y10_031882 [Tritrichomonas musculus]|uniref:Uncharacterized protein n=1 Tax=Tritrichomonas musculus TaxID=1915356 RepID=A0ABR2H0U9_9EUKA